MEAKDFRDLKIKDCDRRYLTNSVGTPDCYMCRSAVKNGCPSVCSYDGEEKCCVCYPFVSNNITSQNICDKVLIELYDKMTEAHCSIVEIDETDEDYGYFDALFFGDNALVIYDDHVLFVEYCECDEYGVKLDKYTIQIDSGAYILKKQV